MMTSSSPSILIFPATELGVFLELALSTPAILMRPAKSAISGEELLMSAP